jgi:2-polyprenyl-3-methyl-5-hydroxy-6-metoxy-1,4-benzoquinol methylase
MEQSGLDKILSTMGAYMQSKILLVATKLNIFSAIDGNEVSATDIAAKLNINDHQCEVFLNALTALDFLQKKDGLYKNTSSSKEFLVGSSINYIGDLLIFQENEWESWNYLYETLIQGEAKGIDETVPMKADELNIYIKAMKSIGKYVAAFIASIVHLDSKKTLLDVGCGSGVYSMEFMKKNPKLQVTLLDLSEVIEIAKKYTDSKSDRITYVPISYNTYEFKEKFDCILCSFVLHENTSEKNLYLIKKFAGSVNKNGMIILHDYFTEDDETKPVFPALFSIVMLLQRNNAKSYSVKEVKSWICSAGKFEIKVINLGLQIPSSLIVATKISD